MHKRIALKNIKIYIKTAPAGTVFITTCVINVFHHTSLLLKTQSMYQNTQLRLVG